MRRRLLVVGFGPFPGVPVNPSGVLAKRMAASPRWRRLDVDADALVMHTAYAAIRAELDPALAERPDAVLMIGVAVRSRRVRIETRARNRMSRLFPDAAGTLPSSPTLEAAGPNSRTSGAAAQALAALRRHGLDVVVSCDAGRYLCNAGYYRTLAGSMPAIFLHIPLPRDPHRPLRRRRRSRRTRPDEWAAAFEQVAMMLLRRSRLQGVGTSAVRRSTESR